MVVGAMVDCKVDGADPEAYLAGLNPDLMEVVFAWCNGAKFVGIQDWQGAMVRLSDKVTRLATFNATGTLGHEGVEDTLLDLASYSLLALLLYQETQ